MEPVDVRAARIARSQHGRVTRHQLVEQAGVAARTVAARLRAGTWTEPIPGVIDLATHTRTWRGEVVEVLLAAGPAAWASHDTAAHLHGFLDAPRPPRIDVLVPRGRHAEVGGHRLRTTRSIGADEVTSRHGIACTTVGRTLLDLAVGTDPDTLERYLADGARRHRASVVEVVGLIDRHRRLPGRRRLLAVVGRLPGDAARLGSPLEVLGVQRLRQLGAPPFELQHVVRDAGGARLKRVDVAWPAVRHLLEFDGVAYHDLAGARAHDEEIRGRMRTLGWHVEVIGRADLDGPKLAGFVERLRRSVT